MKRTNKNVPERTNKDFGKSGGYLLMHRMAGATSVNDISASAAEWPVQETTEGLLGES